MSIGVCTQSSLNINYKFTIKQTRIGVKDIRAIHLA